jgi:hypothetical protein
MNIGERIAEKLRDKGLVAVGDWIEAEPSTTTIAALINQEVTKENTDDSERLDWLEANTQKVGGRNNILMALPFWYHESGQTLREAIDAARGKTLGNETPASTDSVAEEEKSVKGETRTPQGRLNTAEIAVNRSPR